jgi:hypothetical protein
MTPTDDELAAIIAAATALLHAQAPAAAPAMPRWRLADRLALGDAGAARAASGTTRWNASGRAA